MVEKIRIDDNEWLRRLTPEQFRVCRGHATERPFTGKYNACYDKGVYICVCCGNPLFLSDTKFDSGSGWPSFYDVAGPGAVELHEDISLFMKRVEVRCARCDAHLGHVFDDGPQPTGQRYCMNSVALALKRDDAK